ncbi:MAG: hypothetical protein F4229_15450 [Gammaproteobacteria bacterium]|nr:hypothetical protein [Gammaproteobacteria bacterium]
MLTLTHRFVTALLRSSTRREVSPCAATNPSWSLKWGSARG